MKTNENQHEDLTPWIDESLEARLVALVLGESSDFECEELERLMEERPELEVFKDQIEAVHSRLAEIGLGESAGVATVDGAPEDEWRLEPGRRDDLLATLGRVSVKSEGGPIAIVTPSGVDSESAAAEPLVRRKRRPVARVLRVLSWAAAACVLIGAGALTIAIIGGSSDSNEFVAMNNELHTGDAESKSDRERSNYGMEFESEEESFAKARSESSGGFGLSLATTASAAPEPVPSDTFADLGSTSFGNGLVAEEESMRDLNGDGAVTVDFAETRPGLSGSLQGAMVELKAEIVTAESRLESMDVVVAPSAGPVLTAEPASVESFRQLADLEEGNESLGREAPMPSVVAAKPQAPAKAPSPASEPAAPLMKLAPDSDALVATVNELQMKAEPGMVELRNGDADDDFNDRTSLSVGGGGQGGGGGVGAGSGQMIALAEVAAAESDASTDRRGLGLLVADQKNLAADKTEGLVTRNGPVEAPMAQAAQAPGPVAGEKSNSSVSSPGASVRFGVTEDIQNYRMPAQKAKDAAAGRGGTLADLADIEEEEMPEMESAPGDPFASLRPDAVENGKTRVSEQQSSTEGQRKMLSRVENETRDRSVALNFSGDTDEVVVNEFASELSERGFDRRGSKRKELIPEASRLSRVQFPEILAAIEPVSTFSLHVSDVSFKLAQASLASGQRPDVDKIRIEEFVNAFDYGDPMPAAQERVACQNEQTVHPFLAGRSLLRISMRTAAAGRSSQTPLRLTLLLDYSGSMERADRRETIQRAFALLAQQLLPNDQVTLIGFAREPRLLADRVSGGEVGKKLSELVANTASDGGTNLEAALRIAFEKAEEQKLEGAQNRVVLITDGAANLGDAEPEQLAKIVGQMRVNGIAFDAAGVGADGANDEVLEALTRNGDGRYYFLNRPEDADDGFAKQIAGALRPAAMNVKIQVEFNPKRVGHYKLLGFEKHRLKNEDFRNDSVDAAELAAAEAGVALYQVEPLPGGEGDIGFVSVRFRDMSSGRMIEKRWPIPYQPTTPSINDAQDSVRLATAAALFAARLKDDPVGGSAEFKGLAQIVNGLPARVRETPRVQQLLMMIEQARSVIGDN
ncbi:MAG: hypothetical protein ACI8UO_000078 [Verrucomicrobiales bacterium]|jgi:uncharacterized protein YegL